MSATDRVLGLPAVEQLMLRATGSRLRVLAYHGVPDRAAFRAHLAHLARAYTVVSGDQVCGAVLGIRPLPPRALWITFDDGRIDVVDNGIPELDAFGLPATLFVCPGLVLDGGPFWWAEVAQALSTGPLEFEGRLWTDRALVVRLKQVPDEVRRAFLTSLEGGVPAAAERSVSIEQLRRWSDSGREIGNHTWDHPCLTNCSPDEQRRQIIDAHDWLAEYLGRSPTLFAYPNGDVSGVSTSVLAELGYTIGLAFDHRVADTRHDPLRMSRLRLDADVGLPRVRAIAGGAHSATFHALRPRRSKR